MYPRRILNSCMEMVQVPKHGLVPVHGGCSSGWAPRFPSAAGSSACEDRIKTLHSFLRRNEVKKPGWEAEGERKAVLGWRMRLPRQVTQLLIVALQPAGWRM